MTAHQQTRLNELASEYRSTQVHEDSETLSVRVDCYDVSLPELCLQCGEDRDAHLAGGHYFKVAYPVAQFRVAPGGFRQRIDPLERTKAVA